jgi:rhamnose transport system permease protein
MVTWREGLQLVRQGEFVNLPDGLQWFGLAQTAGQWTVVASAAAVVVALGLAMRHLAAGRLVYAVGTSGEAARLAGLRPRFVVFMTFVTMGVLTGVAAMLSVIQSPQVDPKMGTGLELKVIAAVVVGGVAVFGGRGTVWGALVGFLLLACIGPALTHLHVEAYWERAIQGAIILVAVAADCLQERSRAG